MPRRTFSLLPVVALLVLETLTPSASATPPPHARTDYSNLQRPGVGTVEQVYCYAYIHGLAAYEPTPRTGRLTAVTLNIGQHHPVDDQGVAVVQVHRAAPAPTIVGDLVTSVTLPLAQVPTNGYWHITLPQPVPVHRGTPIVLTLQEQGPTCQDGFDVLAVSARGTWLYGFRSWWNNPLPGVQVEIAETGLWR